MHGESSRRRQLKLAGVTVGNQGPSRCGAEPLNEPCECPHARPLCPPAATPHNFPGPGVTTRQSASTPTRTPPAQLYQHSPSRPRLPIHLPQAQTVQWYVNTTTQDPAAGLSTVQPQDRRYRAKAKSPALVNINTLSPQPPSSPFPHTRYRTITGARRNNHRRIHLAITTDTNQVCPTNRRKAPTSRRPSPSSTSAATAVSHSLTWATSSEHVARTPLSRRSRTLRARWAATVRRRANNTERRQEWKC